MNTSTKNLMFLLSAAPMSMAGCLGDEVGDSFSSLTSSSGTFTTTVTTTMTTNETGEAGDGDGDDAGDGDGAPGDGDGAPGDGDGDGAPGDGDGEPGDGDGEPGDGDGDGDEPSGACEEYAAFYAMCYGVEYQDNALAYCQQTLLYAQMYGNECVLAFEAGLVCLSQLSCEDFMMDQPPGCEAQSEAFLDSCS